MEEVPSALLGHSEGLGVWAVPKEGEVSWVLPVKQFQVFMQTRDLTVASESKSLALLGWGTWVSPPISAMQDLNLQITSTRGMFGDTKSPCP